MKVTLFSKHDCQLCDALKYELLDLQVEYRFALDEQFVEEDPSCGEDEKVLVPFVDIERKDGSTVRLDFPVKQPELRRAIHAEMGRQAGTGT